jgi:succinate-semialdehyde dehydrogenase / glutarate-semialdehyde dehydrogenase
MLGGSVHMSNNVRNPRTGQLDYEMRPLSDTELAARCQQLSVAQRQWGRAPLAERIAALTKFRQALQENRQRLTDALIADTGRRAISVIEVTGVISLIDRWCALAPQLLEAAVGSTRQTVMPGITCQTRLHPLGLVAVIAPWNFPLTLSMIDTIPALLAGCAVAVKPSEITPRFAEPLRHCLATVPELNAVLAIFDGDGEAGSALNDCADAICFTGSVITGRKVAEQAARNFIPAFLELGGKDPAVILASADLERAASAILRGAIVNSGQACQSIERIYADESILDEFVALLVTKARAVTVNAGNIRQGHLGPLIFAKQAAIISAQLADATGKGATVHSGGAIESMDGGLYCKPTVLTNVSHDMHIMTEETFGPILPVMAFSSKLEAVQLANDSAYGLSAAVFAGSAEEAEDIACQLTVGAVSINDAALTSMIWEAEKSSFKLSGLGASRMGSSGFLRFFRQQALIRQSGMPLPIDSFSEDKIP